MRAALVLLAATATAAAQPAPYPDPLPPQQPPPQPPPTAPPQAPSMPQYTGDAPKLDPDEVRLLQHGEITDAEHIGGGLANVVIGMGIGQAIQHRWFDKGWIFTLGGGISLVTMIVGVLAFEDDCTRIDQQCESGNRLTDIGLFGLIGFHLWGAIDAFYVPPGYNRRVRALRERVGVPFYSIAPYVSRRDRGATAGIEIRF